MIHNPVKRTVRSAMVITIVSMLFLLLAGGTYAKTTLRWRHWGGNEWLEARVAAFNKSQDGIEVVYEPSGHFDQLIVELAADTAPELFNATEDYGIPLWIEENRGLVYDVTALVERDKHEFFLSEIPEPIIDYMMHAMGGRWLGLPFEVYLGNLIWYNKTLLDEAGSSAPPRDWTINEYVEFSQKLTRDTDGDGVPDIWSNSRPAWGDFYHMRSAMFFNEEGTEFMHNDPAVRRGLKFLDEMHNTYQLVSPGGLDDFAEGRAVMESISTNMYVLELARQAGLSSDDIGLQLWPKDPETGARGVQNTGVTFICINASISAEKLDAAWEFAKFVVGEPGNRAAYEKVGFVQIPPPQINLAREYFFKPGFYYEGFDASLYMECVPYIARRVDLPRTNVQQIRGLLNAGINQVRIGEKPSEVVLAELGMQINAILRQN